MKQTFLAILAIVLFASCEQTPNAEKGGDDMVMEHGEPKPDPHSIDSFKISTSTADTRINRYHKYLVQDSIAKGGAPHLKFDDIKASVQTSFMLDAKMLRTYLNDSTNVEMLDVYLAQEGDGKLTLIYIGAKKKSDDKYEELPIEIEGKKYMLDRAMPCPVCDDRIKLYHPPSGH